jgi:two-component system response regulator DevR
VTVRVFLLDDHEVVRRGVRDLLEAEEDMEVVGEAGTADEALSRIPATRPDVALRAGESLLDPSVTSRVFERLRAEPDGDDGLGDLTPQERRILDLIAEGRTNRQIGETMFLAEKTVKNYVSRLLAKLGMERRAEAAAYAARLAERQRRGS